MSGTAVYILVRDEPYGFSELMGTMRRQSEKDFSMTAFVPPGLSKATAHMVERNIQNAREVKDGDIGTAINEAVKSAQEDFIVILDSAFLPSNQVWLDRLISHLKKADENIVIGRLAHDLYTNWLIQNDFSCDQSLVHREDLCPFYFQFTNFAARKSVFLEKPFPSAGIDDFALRWALQQPGKYRFVADAVTTHLEHISIDGFSAAYKRYGRESKNLGSAFSRGAKFFFRGIYRDIAFAFEKRKPQWIFFSFYLRSAQAIGFLKGALS